MRIQYLVSTCLAAITSTSLAEHIPFDHILTTSATPTSTKVADSACTNGPLTRSCWSNGYSVATDFDAKWPTTGNTVSYNLEITNGTCNPDGHGSKPCQLFNNQYPGPLITANWGDTISVTVKNSLTANGTGVHWHGIRQLGTCPQDGVPGITECPLAPGDTKTYTFKATQFGTTWYHSHYSSQYGEGAFGPIVINGPASANYDIDLGPMMLNDFYYQTAFQVGSIAHQNLQNGAPPPPADNLIVNGTNKNANGGGSYGKVTLTKGKKYRLRLINMSVDNNIRVSLDNHPFQVITADLVPIKPFVANWVLLAIGQRYDVIFTANQTADNYWFRAEVATDCASSNNFHGRSIFTYSGASGNDPTTSAFANPSTGCVDMSPLVPWVKNTVDSTAFVNQVGNLQVDLAQEQATTNGQNIVVWAVNFTAINVDWDKPTLEYVKTGNTSYPSVFNLIEIPNEGIWSYWIIQETPGTLVPIPHPIHLHGHDFYVLGTGSGTFDKSTSPSTLQYDNPIRRDTTFLPGGGWLAIGFPTDNPGAWLMHCHIAWHVADGLAVQFLESKSTMPLPDSAWESTCSKFQTYDKNPGWPKTDSGLKARGIESQ
ncbi:putative multicopper oxidase, type 1 [Lindgomyces ingoldianus]|uniref:Multicopper oxidase, type 1 n=1 Tax=Lindgomyces ingoldianus TaxID=673940 RepID=A0ACB6R032_9PLEO|nr:putative multicopper oxidase, type 1 [Lindgomyces ingoldianus]KAF2471867.1 putative multicopper oxidase, type 1 [Lindgomyces ingoldianus]